MKIFIENKSCLLLLFYSVWPKLFLSHPVHTDDDDDDDHDDDDDDEEDEKKPHKTSLIKGRKLAGSGTNIWPLSLIYRLLLLQ